jgi:hypothetical protein
MKHRALRRRYGRSGQAAGPHAPFRVAKTYDVVSEESAREGDVADRGYEFEDTTMTLRDAVREVEKLGHIDEAQAHGDMLRFYDSEEHMDYGTGDVTTYALHIRGPANAIRRLKSTLESKGVRFH